LKRKDLTYWSGFRKHLGVCQARERNFNLCRHDGEARGYVRGCVRKRCIKIFGWRSLLAIARSLEWKSGKWVDLGRKKVGGRRRGE